MAEAILYGLLATIALTVLRQRAAPRPLTSQGLAPGLAARE